MEVRSFSRFLLVGAINTITSLIIFPILYFAFVRFTGINLLLALGYVFTTLFAFFSHKIFTFESAGRVYVEGPLFFLLSGATYLVNVAFLNVLLPVVDIHPVILQTIIGVGLQVGNFLIMRRLIFLQRTQKAADVRDA